MTQINAILDVFGEIRINGEGMRKSRSPVQDKVRSHVS